MSQFPSILEFTTTDSHNREEVEKVLQGRKISVIIWVGSAVECRVDIKKFGIFSSLDLDKAVDFKLDRFHESFSLQIDNNENIRLEINE